VDSPLVASFSAGRGGLWKTSDLDGGSRVPHLKGEEGSLVMSRECSYYCHGRVNIGMCFDLDEITVFAATNNNNYSVGDT